MLFLSLVHIGTTNSQYLSASLISSGPGKTANTHKIKTSSSTAQLVIPQKLLISFIWISGSTPGQSYRSCVVTQYAFLSTAINRLNGWYWQRKCITHSPTPTIASFVYWRTVYSWSEAIHFFLFIIKRSAPLFLIVPFLLQSASFQFYQFWLERAALPNIRNNWATNKRKQHFKKRSNNNRKKNAFKKEGGRENRPSPATFTKCQSNCPKKKKYYKSIAMRMRSKENKKHIQKLYGHKKKKLKISQRLAAAVWAGILG